MNTYIPYLTLLLLPSIIEGMVKRTDWPSHYIVQIGSIENSTPKTLNIKLYTEGLTLNKSYTIKPGGKITSTYHSLFKTGTRIELPFKTLNPDKILFFIQSIDKKTNLTFARLRIAIMFSHDSRSKEDKVTAAIFNDNAPGDDKFMGADVYIVKDPSYSTKFVINFSVDLKDKGDGQLSESKITLKPASFPFQ